MLSWFKQQKEFANKTVENLQGTDSLLNQLQSYNGSKTWGRSPNHKFGDRYYYGKWKRGQLSQILYYKTGNDTTEHLIFYSWNINPGMRYNLSALEFSPNEKNLFCSIL